MPEALSGCNDFAALMERAGAAEDRGDIEAALAGFSRALALSPEHIILRCHVGRILSQQRRYTDTETLMLEGLALRPESISLTRDLAKALAAQGKFGAAINLARELIWPLQDDVAFRLDYAAWLVKIGEYTNSIENIQQVLRQDPDCEQAARQLADLWHELGETEKAIIVEKSLGIAARSLPNDEPAPPGIAYLRALFDCYAERFDEDLKKLEYSAPGHLREALNQITDKNVKFHVLDLGCGTGLSGLAVKPLAQTMSGVDISPKMLARAERLGIYDRLIEGDIASWLNDQHAIADLIIAGDVLTYIGDLESLFVQISDALRIPGYFAATVEYLDDGTDDFILRKTRRYAHSGYYIHKCATAAALEVVMIRKVEALRREGKSEVPGLVFILKREN